jgi:hypothetical protein
MTEAKWVPTIAYRWVCRSCDREMLTSGRYVPARCECGSYVWDLAPEKKSVKTLDPRV